MLSVLRPNSSNKTRSSWRSAVGDYTFHYHRQYAIYQGLFASVFTPGTLVYILLTYFDEPGLNKEMLSAFIYGMSGVSLLSAPMWSAASLRSGRQWLIAGIVGRLLPALAMAAMFGPWSAALLFGLMSFLCAGIPPAIATLMSVNYSRSARDRYFGRAQFYAIGTMILVNWALMKLLDLGRGWIFVVVPAAGVFGFLALYSLYRAKQRNQHFSPSPVVPPHVVTPFDLMRRITAPTVGAIGEMIHNRNFGLYELGFFFYGIGFMVTIPVVPVFYKQVFGLSLSDYSFHTIVLFSSATMATHIFMRGATSRWSAARVAATAFMLVTCLPLGLMLAGALHSLWIAALTFIIFGVAMAFVDYAWTLGPIRFADGRDAMPFVAAHTMMAGVRGLIGYPLSYILMRMDQEHYVFSLIVPLCSLALGISIMLVLSRRFKA